MDSSTSSRGNDDPSNDLKTFRVSLGAPGGFAAPTTYLASFEVAEILPTNANDDGADDLFVFARSLPGEGTASRGGVARLDRTAS